MKIPPFLLVIVVAIAVAVAFFKIYGRVTRPDVPLQVSATVENFAPGVAIGSSVKASKAKLGDVRWIQHLGFVGVLDRHDFALIRLAPAAAARHKVYGDDRALVESVELVSLSGDAISTTMVDLGIVFRGSPKDGCIIPGTDDMPYRRVQYWTTPSDRGGVAMVTDWTFTPSTSTAGVNVWSMIAWAGPFKGSETLLAKFDARSCLQIVGA
ncbi:MAG TPA: hypothetical protein VK571_00745 [Gemmatimonadaceae bacterium]|jgi:hypothetical protein|nr:hypothetical protein [Gemmatimonadaceae bacterium]